MFGLFTRPNKMIPAMNRKKTLINSSHLTISTWWFDEPVVDMTVKKQEGWHPVSFIGEFVSEYVFKDKYNHFTKKINPELIRYAQQAKILYDKKNFVNTLERCERILELVKPENTFSSWGQCADVAFKLRRNIWLISGDFSAMMQDFSIIYLDEHLSAVNTLDQAKLSELKFVYTDLLISIREIYSLIKDNQEKIAGLSSFISQLPLRLADREDDGLVELCNLVSKMKKQISVPVEDKSKFEFKP